MKVHDQQPDPLLAGFFSTADAVRLVGVHSQLIRGWLNGYPNSVSGPIINRDFEGTRTISFLDVMELRFIQFFRKQGVSMPTLRKAADRARKEWGVNHPLALSNSKIVTDRRKVFAKVAEEGNDQVAWDMASGQHEIWITIEQSIAHGVEFNSDTSLAQLWHPMPQFPDVVIDPRVAFGKPIVQGTPVPTSTLFRQFKAEGSKERVAKWFDVPIDVVAKAIDYELVAA